MDIDGFVEKINSGKYSQKELVTLYKNTLASKNASESDREKIVSAIELSLKIKFPAAAKKMFGAKDADARDILDKIFNSMIAQFDLSSNTVGNGVKTGGLMISGEYYIDVYLSYKNNDKQAAFLNLTQEKADGELVARVGRYQTASKDTSRLIKDEVFDLSDLVAMENEYKNCLVEVVV